MAAKVWENSDNSSELNASPRICQSYRGFAHVGRSGPQTVQSGQKVDGKIQYARNPNQQTLRKTVSIITGDHRSFNIYISPNYFSASVELSKTPWGPLFFCEHSRAVCSFSGRKTNTIEELASKFGKVSYFLFNFGAPAGVPPERPGNGNPIEDAGICLARSRGAGPSSFPRCSDCVR